MKNTSTNLPLQPPCDTTPEASRAYYQALRELGPEGRARRAFDVWTRQRSLMEAGIRNRHPDYSAEEVRLAVVRLRLGERVFEKLFLNEDIRP